MTDRPIIMSAPMVRAILDGRKSMTRMVLKPQPAEFKPNVLDITPPEQNEDGEWRQLRTIWSHQTLESRGEPLDEIWEPLRVRYAPGDRLWGRETWCHGLAELDQRPVYYRADEVADDGLTRWRPSIYMPKWASRLTLVVNEVKVERLQEISEEDAKAEGMVEPYLGDGDPPFIECATMVSRTMQFCNLWNSLQGPGAWDENPWVVPVSFTHHKVNIGRMP